jgi:DNA-binding response OmpR family regulator
LPKVEEDILLGPLIICDQHKTVTVYGKTKHLTRQEYELLRILATEEGRALSRDELAENLGRRYHTLDPDDVKKYIYRLRKKIEPNPCAPRWIQNVRGVGYRLMVDDNDEATRGARSHA